MQILYVVYSPIDRSLIGYQRKKPLRLLVRAFRGSKRIRTAVNGFADRYLTTRTWNHFFCEIGSLSQLRCKVNAFFLILQIILRKNFVFLYFFTVTCVYLNSHLLCFLHIGSVCGVNPILTELGYHDRGAGANSVGMAEFGFVLLIYIRP